MMKATADNRPLRLYHVAPAFPPALGGMEKVVQVLARTQAEKGFNVSVITSGQRVVSPIRPEKFPVVRLKSWLVANSTIMPFLFPKLLRIGRNSVVHVHITQAYTPDMVWLASLVKRFSYIAHVHLDVPPSGWAGFLLKPYKRIILRRVLRGARFVVVFTQDQKRYIGRKYGLDPAKVKVIPNGVEGAFYYDQPRSMHKTPRLLFVGRLGYQKNLQQLLHALDCASDEFTTTIVGDGEQGPDLKKLAADLKLKNVTFAGRKDGEELLKYYKQADIFVLTSEREGMPLVLLEAMAMGLPIIATNVTGSRDVIENGKNGLLVPYNNTDEFRAALLKIKTNATAYTAMSQASRMMADQYSWEKIAAKFEGLYKKAAA